MHAVSLEVNAAQRYQEEVRFDQQGKPCLDARLAEILRLKLSPSPGECLHVEATWPQAQIKAFPGDFRLEITLPEEAFDPEKLRNEQRGGYAALMNYDLFGRQVEGRIGRQQTLQAMLEPGINISNWVIRNRSSYVKTDSQDTLKIYETSAIRDFPRWGIRTQIGEFGAGGTMSGGLPVTGVQLSSNDIRRHGAVLAVPLQGNVSGQATVEVKQRGQVVYRTLLPAGPFSLQQLGQAIPGIETVVEITEADGQKQRFVVTPGRDGDHSQGAGYQLALGRYRNYSGGDAGSPPALLMGEKTFGVGKQGQLGVGGILSSGYQHLVWQGSHGDEQGNWLSGGMVYARGRQSGMQLDGQGQVRLPGNLSLALSSRYNTKGFQEADEVLSSPRQNGQETFSRLRYNGGLSLSWGHPTLGAFTYSLSHERYYHDDQKSWLHALSYGKKVGNASLNLSLQSSAYDRAALYMGVSLPISSGSLSGRLQRRQDNQMTLGSSWQGKVGERMEGYLDMSRSADGSYQHSGSLSGNTPYTRLSAGVAHAEGDSTSLSLSSSGSLGVANGTWVTSPARAGDTMVLIRVPGRAGVKISGPGGDGLTDYAGDALLPSVTPYMPVRAEIDTLSLPLNLRLNSTETQFELARGTVAERQFRVTEVRQLLLTIKDEQGKTLPTGASVHDEKGQLLGTLLGDGNLMLVNEDIGKALRVRRVNVNECQVSYDVPAEFDPLVLYEERDAVCR